MKKIFKIDITLYILGFLTAITGFCFHIAGHGTNHHVWAIWAYVHTICSVAFVVFLVQHLRTHKAWMRSLKKSPLDRRRKIVLTLGAFAIAVACTGLMLLAIKGANSHVGLWHYRLGIILTMMSIGHASKRHSILRKAIKNK